MPFLGSVAGLAGGIAWTGLVPPYFYCLLSRKLGGETDPSGTASAPFSAGFVLVYHPHRFPMSVVEVYLGGSDAKVTNVCLARWSSLCA